MVRVVKFYKRCISFDSYIKPQPLLHYMLPMAVVYLLIPTSNHNSAVSGREGSCVVYLLIPTSNHNLAFPLLAVSIVVYLLIPTSNHNVEDVTEYSDKLYIF